MSESQQTSGKTDPFDLQGKFEVGGYAHADQPTHLDSLGFEPYVEALAAFLRNPQTMTPLTVSIEGKWGAGKSSFMRQLKHCLESPAGQDKSKVPSHGGIGKARTVWFNAWRHDRREALWATFALVATENLRRQLGFWGRRAGDLRLLKFRVQGLRGWLHLLAGTAIWWAIIALITLFAAEASTRHYQFVGFLLGLAGYPFAKSPNDAASNLAGWSLFQYVLAGALVSSGLFLWWKKNLSNSLQFDLGKFVRRPDYEGQASFIECFHEDFERILRAYLGPGRLFVFIDDVDRCSDDNIYQLLQGINLMIGCEGPIIFILGMDREKTAALLNSKGGGVTRSEKDTDPNLDYGARFLEKFIQVPFRVPTPTFRSMDAYLVQITGGKAVYGPGIMGRLTAERTRVVDVILGADSPIVKEMAMISAPYLGKNPRRVKQFVNVFRLQAYIAANLGLLDSTEYEESSSGSQVAHLSIEQIGKFVAITLGWPEILDDIADDPKLISELASIAEGTLKNTPENAHRWESDGLLLVFLRACVETGGDRFSLKNAPVERLLEIWPRRIAKGLKEHVIRAGPDSEYVLGHGDSKEDAWADAAKRLRRAGM